MTNIKKRNQILPGISDFPFQYSLHTRWKDMDIFGHVNNAIFLSYIEDARINFFNSWNINDEERSIIMASLKIDYLRQIDHPTNLIVGERISRIGNKSFDIESGVYIEGEADPVSSSMVTCVCFDYTRNHSVPVYPEIIADYEKNISS